MAANPDKNIPHCAEAVNKCRYNKSSKLELEVDLLLAYLLVHSG